MDEMEIFKKIALDIEEKLGNNHISTILHLEEVGTDEKLKEQLPQFLVIVKKFDKYVLMILSNIVREHQNKVGIPFVVEYNDIQGMLDSIPKEFLKIKMDYTPNL